MPTAKKAVKKAAKKKAAKKLTPQVHRLRIGDNGTFDPDPLNNVDFGDLIKLVASGNVCFDITIDIEVVACGGAGGPITIHS